MANRFLASLVAAVGLLVSEPALAYAQGLTHSPEPEACEGVCVAHEDMLQLRELLKERNCLDTEEPRISLDPINIVVDKQGRIFYSGADPSPYTVRITWCHYEMEAKGKVKTLAAVQEPPSYGFRFRPKAYTGLLLAEPFRKDKTATDAIDAGLMIDPLYVKDFNLNFHVGFRSVGVGIGVDVTKNFGASVAYALAWDGLSHNPQAMLWFAFW